MKIGPPLLKLLNKIYAPAQMVPLRFGRYDLAMQTDQQGRPILLFIGQKGDDGKIKGDHFARRLLTDEQGNVLKDHWDYKGRIA